MRTLITIGLMAIFTVACTKPEINNNAYETEGIKKSESVNTEGDGSEYDLDNSED